MPEHRFSQKNIVQKITLPLSACLFPVVHGHISSPGKTRASSCPSNVKDLLDQAMFIHCSMFQFWCLHAPYFYHSYVLKETHKRKTCLFYLFSKRQHLAFCVMLSFIVSHSLMFNLYQHGKLNKHNPLYAQYSRPMKPFPGVWKWKNPHWVWLQLAATK